MSPDMMMSLVQGLGAKDQAPGIKAQLPGMPERPAPPQPDIMTLLAGALGGQKLNTAGRAESPNVHDFRNGGNGVVPPNWLVSTPQGGPEVQGPIMPPVQGPPTFDQHLARLINTRRDLIRGAGIAAQMPGMPPSAQSIYRGITRSSSDVKPGRSY